MGLLLATVHIPRDSRLCQVTIIANVVFLVFVQLSLGGNFITLTNAGLPPPEALAAGSLGPKGTVVTVNLDSSGKCHSAGLPLE